MAVSSLGGLQDLLFEGKAGVPITVSDHSRLLQDGVATAAELAGPGEISAAVEAARSAQFLGASLTHKY